MEQSVEVPDTNIPVSNEDDLHLRTMYNREMIITSDYHAVDIYINVRHHVYAHHDQ